MNPTTDPRGFLRHLFDVAVKAADPRSCITPYMSAIPKPKKGGRTVVLGAGKAASAMVLGLESNWDSDKRGPLEGLAITRYGYSLPTRDIRLIEGGHPMPDKAGLAAAEELLAIADDLTAADVAICLISGGGSALLTTPADPLTLRDKQIVNRSLLDCGATISEINCVRKHLSKIKGGRLAQAIAPAACVTFLVSDVPGDDPATVASGPTAPDPTTLEDARAVFDKYGVKPPRAVRAFLDDPNNETPKPAKRATKSTVHTIARPLESLEAAATAAQQAGVHPIILSDRIEGESQEVAKVVAAMSRHIAEHQNEIAPCVLLSGGETTVTINGKGRGGPNGEFALSFMIEIDGHPRIWALSCDTDGVDGSEDNAGAIATPDSLKRATDRGINPRKLLSSNDSYGAFAVLEDLIVTGPTYTNVNDFRAVLIL